MSDAPDRALSLGVLGTIAAGGVAGGAARYASGLLLDGTPLPWETVLVNLSGCLLLGVVTAAVPEHRLLRYFVATGLLGAFTTFSTLAVETVALLGRAPVLAAGYLLVSLLGGPAAAWSGLVLGRKLKRQRRE